MVKTPINSDSDDTGEAREREEESILKENNSKAASEEETRELQDDANEVERLKKQSEEYLDTLRRVQADFENYRKRVKRERADTIAFANEGVIRKFLGVVDNLDRGISCAEGEGGSEEDLLAGIKLVRKQFLDALSDYDVEPFESAGQPFDPTRHECLYVLERDDLPDQTNVEELEKGFKMHDRVLRVAKVSVSKKPQAEDGGGEA